MDRIVDMFVTYLIGSLCGFGVGWIFATLKQGWERNKRHKQ